MSTAVATGRPVQAPPLVAHVVFRFDVGGLENGLVNLVDSLPRGEFRHAIIALTEATDFRRRIRRDDVTFHELHKRPGQDPAAYLRLYRLLRQLRPAVLHTRNFGTLDCQLVGWLAGVPVRIHGEHGWDVHDPDGTNRKHRLLRRALAPLVHRFVAVSRDLERWLVDVVSVPERQITRVCNGVDTDRFAQAAHRPARSDTVPGTVVVGSVTRFEVIKDPLNLVGAFIEARRRLAGSGIDLRLEMIGDGPLRAPALALLYQAGEARAAWLPGSRDDVAARLGGFDLFVLGSRREGISNTVLEAMAAGLPVVATATGGNLELVVPGETGTLVPPQDREALAGALVAYARDGVMREAQGRAARRRAEQEFSLRGMTARYLELYRAACRQTGVLA